MGMIFLWILFGFLRFLFKDVQVIQNILGLGKEQRLDRILKM